MSKILTRDEAQKFADLMLEPLGYTPVILDYDANARQGEAYRACNSSKITKKTGFLWWKKTKEIVELDPVWVGWHWEEVIDKMNTWIKTKALPRVALAEKYRDEYAKQEADKVLHEELSK